MAQIIEVSPVMMRDKANTLKTSASTIQTLTEEIKSEVTRMKTTWDGEASDKFLTKFNGLNDNFQERYDKINKYAQFLLEAADIFQQVEDGTISAEDALNT